MSDGTHRSGRKINLRNVRLRKPWLILIVALLIGGLAAFAAQKWMNEWIAETEAKRRGPEVEVVVARSALKRGDELTTSTLAVRRVPSEFAQSGAVKPQEFERIDGERLATTLQPGEMLMWPMIEGRKAPTFSARVGAGRRAITVPVDEINSISGLLEPGDTIDLIVTIEQNGSKRIIPFWHGVRVLATGQRSADDPKTGGRRNYSTVTLDASPDDARNVITARELGKLTALLRSPQEQKEVLPSVDLAALTGSGAAGHEPSDPGVQILYGGRARLPSESRLTRSAGADSQRPSAPRARRAESTDSADNRAELQNEAINAMRRVIQRARSSSTDDSAPRDGADRTPVAQGPDRSPVMVVPTPGGQPASVSMPTSASNPAQGTGTATAGNLSPATTSTSSGLNLGAGTP